MSLSHKSKEYLFKRYIAERHIPFDVFKIICSIKKDVGILISDFGLYMMYILLKETSLKVLGSVAEVGVYKGGSALFISKFTDKYIYLFDTFTGLPNLSNKDDPNQYTVGQYPANFVDVQKLFKGNNKVELRVGIFPYPALERVLENVKFSFVHLDLDLYNSTLDALKWFYPRMSKGGVILIHDYPDAQGVKLAVDQFFIDKNEITIKLPHFFRQCFIVKL